MLNGWTQTTALINSGVDHYYFLYKFLLLKGFCPVSEQLPPSTFINRTKTHCLLIKSSTLTFSITKEYLNYLNLKLTPSTCKDTTCLLGEIGYIKSTQLFSGIPHVSATRMLAQQKSRSTIPPTFPRLLVVRRLTFFLWQPSQKKTPDETIPPEYSDYADIFSVTEASKLPDTQVTHNIDLFLGNELPWKPIYPMLAIKLETHQEYLYEEQTKGWICSSTSSAGTSVIFVKEADGSLCLCVDYCSLNVITKMNQYPLPHIDELIDWVTSATLFTKLDLCDTYHCIRICRRDEWKMAFHTWYSHYKYLVMPFGLTNAPATFQHYINEVLKDLLDICDIIYLDDILVYWWDLDEHKNYICNVLLRFYQYKLYTKLLKCKFHCPKVKYLEFLDSLTTSVGSSTSTPTSLHP